MRLPRAQSGGGGGVTLVSITVTPDPAQVYVGLDVQLTATGTYSDDSTMNITSAVEWSSSDEGSGTISSGSGGGLLTGVGAGTPTITATLGEVSGSTEAEIVLLGEPARGTLSMAYSPNVGVAAATFTIPCRVPSDSITASITINNSSVAYPAGSHGPAVVGVDIGIFPSDGTGKALGTVPVYKWTNQTIPANGVDWESPAFGLAAVRGSDGNIVIAYSTPEGATLYSVISVALGTYVFGTASIDPLPIGGAVNPNAIFTVRAKYSTNRPRIVVDGDSLSQAYHGGFGGLTRDQAAYYRIGPDNDWAVDDCGLAGSTLEQWNNDSERPRYRLGQLLDGAIGLCGLSINDLPSVDLASYQAEVLTKVTVWRAAGVTKIVWVNLSPADAAYPGTNTLRQSINAWLATLPYEIDAVVDLDAISRNPANHAALLPSGDIGDGTHFNAYLHGLLAAAITSAITPLLP